MFEPETNRVDQSLFSLAKQIQWQWPGAFGEVMFSVIFGGLHIEMAALKLLGDLLKETQWWDGSSGRGRNSHILNC